ncbi:MAG: adenylosuccinate synthase [Bacteroidota bacterium]
MSVSVVIGSQWGDEGKGKIVDLLSKTSDVVARYQGGANAGHTICWGDKTVVLHLVPSGIFNPDTTCVIGNGVVIDPFAILKELRAIREEGYDVEGRLLISQNAHVIMPYHKAVEGAREKSRSGKAIGTTGRGIGPAYVDKFARTGIRMGDFLNRDILRAKIEHAVAEKNAILEGVYGAEPLDAAQMVEEYLALDKELAPYIADTTHYLGEAIAAGKRVMAEGAQGSLLDVDFGTYPYVTSSHPTVGGCCTGLGIPPTRISRVIGIVKAYCTRVGNGPFPTELLDDIGAQLQEVGHEFGATTGRPRRCGWLDLVALKYSAMINGLTELVITKLDVMSGLDEIKVCTSYRYDGKETSQFPNNALTLEQVEPVYISMPGWKEDIVGIDRFEDLPAAAQSYLQFVANQSGVDISMISTGPKRSQTIMSNSALLEAVPA